MSQVLKEMPSWAKDVDALGRPARYPDWDLKKIDY